MLRPNQPCRICTSGCATDKGLSGGCSRPSEQQRRQEPRRLGEPKTIGSRFHRPLTVHFVYLLVVSIFASDVNFQRRRQRGCRSVDHAVVPDERQQHLAELFLFDRREFRDERRERLPAHLKMVHNAVAQRGPSLLRNERP